jgi:uncharacterized protein (DUF1501 family)
MTNRINRRQFVSQAAASATALTLAPGFINNTVAALAGEGAPRTGPLDNRILLILQLDGGNDGLNTLVPYGDDEYYRARPQVAIKPDRVLKLNERLGLHPELVELKQMYDEGSLALVQNVGYPNPNRSHFTSTEIWQQAVVFDPTKPRDVLDGWVGRYFEQQCANVVSPALGLQVGDRATLAFASRTPRGVTIANPAILEWRKHERGLQGVHRGAQKVKVSDGDDFAYVRQMGHSTLTLADRIRAARQTKSRVEYPPYQLSQSLRLIGQLIAAGLPTRVYYTALTGFDTHVTQDFRHGGLMQELSQALSLFARDMKAAGQWDRILVMTFSEFGRRLKENGSLGTDHGAASMMFLAGGSVVPGLHGVAPDLHDLDDGDIKQKIDFREVYAAVLQDWFGVSETKPILLGNYQPLPVIRTVSGRQAGERAVTGGKR